ncbi:unnamed protein product [Dracunculus medinensis]|uniref:ShKT domain-containing protein n=1 Tax=Dracunculus medinensis TaxID=318479 RepID=A0A0N4URM9_DRAME|nr:unnamed protein product [Dracunculus medinensis]
MQIIEECVKLVGDKKRPTVGSCPEDPVCSSIFVYDQQDLTNVLENNLKDPNACQKLGRNVCTIAPKVALSMCPFTCGLCNRPRAGGICPDENDNCAAIFLLDPACSMDFMKRSCKKTCGLKDCLPGNSTAASSLTCNDLHPQCRENSRYCNIGDYAVVMRRVCRLICRHCTP